jgi:tetratricopeptide (TPR) repeat protein
MFDAGTSQHRAFALQHAERAMAQDQLDPYCLLNYARAKWLFGDVEEAMVWAERALNLNPNYAFGRYNNAIFHNILCNAETAELEVSEALALSPIDPYRHWMLAIKGLAALLKGDDTAAVTCVEQALHAPIPHLYIFMISAIVYSCTGQESKAFECVTRVQERGVPFGSSDFLFHYNFRDQVQKSRIEDELIKLGI